MNDTHFLMVPLQRECAVAKHLCVFLTGVVAWISARLSCPFLCVAYATRTETGFAVLTILFSTATAMATSPC